jgi:DNA-binding LacI/PurR family transcriptional regulator
MADIARLAGVSVPTVSYILNGRAKERHLSQATAERVMAIARDLGYVRNTVARNLRK